MKKLKEFLKFYFNVLFRAKRNKILFLQVFFEEKILGIYKYRNLLGDKVLYTNTKIFDGEVVRLIEYFSIKDDDKEIFYVKGV